MGLIPTLTVAVTVLVAALITETLLLPELATYSFVSTLTMSHYQMKISSLDHIKPNTLFAAKSMTANGVTV